MGFSREKRKGVSTLQAGCLTWWGVPIEGRTLRVRPGSMGQRDARCPGPNLRCPLFPLHPTRQSPEVTLAGRLGTPRALGAWPGASTPTKGARAGRSRVRVPGAGPQLGGTAGLSGGGLGEGPGSGAGSRGEEQLLHLLKWRRTCAASAQVPLCWGCFSGQSPSSGRREHRLTLRALAVRPSRAGEGAGLRVPHQPPPRPEAPAPSSGPRAPELPEVHGRKGSSQLRHRGPCANAALD